MSDSEQGHAAAWRRSWRSRAAAWSSGFAALLLAVPAAAVVTVSDGAGSAVGTADRTATFDSSTAFPDGPLDRDFIDLNDYFEDGLFVTVDDFSHVGFDPWTGNGPPDNGPDCAVIRCFHYGSGGNFSWVSIRGTDGARMFALEYRHGDGFGGGPGSDSHLRWRTFRDLSMTDTGTRVVTKGNVIGFSDPEGFDELQVVAAFGAPPPFGGSQAIALDDVRVDFEGSTSVLDIQIDVKPEGPNNVINTNTADKIEVALLGSETFDVAQVDETTLAFGPAGAPPFLWAGVTTEDIDLDDFDDLLVFFRLEESGIQGADTQACVTGELMNGATLQGCDAITVVACGLGFELAFLLPPLAWLRTRRMRRR